MGVLDQTKIDVQKLASGVNPLTDDRFCDSIMRGG